MSSSNRWRVTTDKAGTWSASAERGKLKDPVVLEQQVRRMLADRRATTFINNFWSQWLIMRNALLVEPDPELFHDFDNTLREAMVRETERICRKSSEREPERPGRLRANYTFLNERLAKRYGIANVYGSRFRRVAVTDEMRRGLLGQASVLNDHVLCAPDVGAAYRSG